MHFPLIHFPSRIVHPIRILTLFLRPQKQSIPFLLWLFSALCPLLLASCADVTARALANNIGQDHGFHERIFLQPHASPLASRLTALLSPKPTGSSAPFSSSFSSPFSSSSSSLRSQRPLALFGLLKKGRSDILHVYVEGDGHAYESATRPSLQPTPGYPVSLWLAVRDPAPSVLYLARPGQYLDHVTYPCDPKYWTSARLSPEVVAALGHAIDEAKKESAAQKIVLVGFSGGGGLCALLAAERKDVLFLGTIAGNLSLERWCREKGLKPLTDSIDPLTVAEQLHNLPQRHILGAKDAVISFSCIQDFCRAAKLPAPLLVPDLAHLAHWHTVWDYNYVTDPGKQPSGDSPLPQLK